ncbi:MAG: hypothetical protein H0W72_09465 [Planctomycetes bacterium]|nr:hypothetical protein [Planctomycetota bacterium]
MSRLHLLTIPTLAALLAPTFAAETPDATPGPVRNPPTPLVGTGGAGAEVGAAVGGAVESALRNLRFGAYGEMHYNNFTGSTETDTLDFHRFVLLAETQIAERWRFVGEIEFEHALIEDGADGAVEVEQAYVEYRYLDDHVARAGQMLVPISIGNLYHEPTLFHGVERPLFDRVIIPTTWFENGVGAYGRISDGLDYGVAVQAGLNGADLDPETGIRGGRQEGSESAAEDLMVTARLDYRPLNGLWLAAAINHGGADQSEVGGDYDITVYTLEARYAAHGFDTGVSWAQVFNSHTEAVTPGANNLPDSYYGLSAFLAYDVLSLITESTHQVYLFGRYEALELHDDVPSQVTVDDSLNQQVYQYGVTWKPNPWVAIKADYRDVENDSDAPSQDSWNLGVGFAF